MDTLFSDELLTRSLFAFLMFGCVAGLLAGVALLLRPVLLLQASKLMNRWISTRKWTHFLGRSIRLDAWLYRYNKFYGAVLLVGAGYIVYFFTAVFDRAGALINIFKNETIPPVLMEGLIDVVVLIALTGAIFVALISLFLLFRPSMLREFELRANHMTSLRIGLKPLETQRGNLDQYVFKYQRLAGILILTGSIYTLAALANSWNTIF